MKVCFCILSTLSTISLSIICWSNHPEINPWLNFIEFPSHHLLAGHHEVGKTFANFDCQSTAGWHRLMPFHGPFGHLAQKRCSSYKTKSIKIYRY